MDSSLKSKILWRSRRGMLELDLLLAKFNKENLDALDDAAQHCLLTLLNEDDPVLFSWLMDFSNPDNEDYLGLVQLIRNTN